MIPSHKLLNPRYPGTFTEMPPKLLTYLILALLAASAAAARRHPSPASSAAAGEPVYLWPLPRNFTSGSRTLLVDPDLALDGQGPGGAAAAVAEAFERYRSLVFSPWAHAARNASGGYDVGKLTVVVASADEKVPCVCVRAAPEFGSTVASSGSARTL